MNAPTDEQLLTDYLAGHTDCFELLVRRHSRGLYEFLARFTGSTAAAEDIVQETFLQVHLSASGFDCQRRFRPWLFTIAANKARDLLRSRARKREVPLDAPLSYGAPEGQSFVDFLADSDFVPSAGLEAQELREIVKSVIDEMPEHSREVMLLAYYQRMPYKEIAGVLDIPLGTVKSRLHAAVQQFGRAYKAATRHRPDEGA